MGGVVLGILVWQEGGDYVALLIALGALALWALARWLVRRQREGKVTLLDPDLFGQATSGSESPGRCCRTSPWVAR